MNDDNGNDFFEDIKPNLQKLDEKLHQINENLLFYQLEQFSNGKGKGSLGQQFRKTPEGYGALGPIEDFIQESIVIVDKLNKYRSHLTLALEVEKAKLDASLAHGKLDRKAVRGDMWILWGQKLIRWTLGVIVVVVLYSAIVWVSEKYEFIKIPIRDWIPSTINSQA